ncbi:class I SAM-dependent methyltransferase [Geomicrobium sediminis]|uniref:16S rRNA (Guanine1207-N2)-methyltransferase n=1 Tax=Geomicrobium sediminis TaxID=1347788 RepID=A0ABS2PIM9_9BACL|nr:methyltransferase [Geomicrobium sediminis]MBM7634678.1 16S rRNA (guanine1207-N2)-methyltransferase [Geomicrobium sediminis]
MSSHYYDKKPTVSSERQTVGVTIKEKEYSFYTDRGVFSKGGVDFGSAFLANAYQAPAVDGPVLDVGCGYGPLGISIAGDTGRQVWMTDVNERAVELATENAVRNHVEKQVTIVRGSGYEAIPDEKLFASIVTNPPIRAGKEVVHHFFEEAHKRLVDSGELWVVIQKKQGAPSTKKKLEELFKEVVEEGKSKGYSLYRCYK